MCVDLVGRRKRELGGDLVERVHFAVERLDARERRLGSFPR